MKDNTVTIDREALEIVVERAEIEFRELEEHCAVMGDPDDPALDNISAAIETAREALDD